MRNIDRIRGCLMGGAIGDALGYAVEFMSEESIFEEYGENGITEYALTNGKAVISDDTQMSLFTACGIVLGKVHNAETNEKRLDYIHGCYLDWLKAQSPFGGKSVDASYSWLSRIPELNVPRAPGNTCLSALMSDERGSIENRINHSMGCGGVMRAAPCGLLYGGILSQEEIDLLGAESAALTHGHELGFMPAAMLTHIVSQLAFSDSSILDAVNSAIESAEKIFRGYEGISELVLLIEDAKSLAKEQMKPTEAIHRLGEGWVAQEALAIAIYCALRYNGSFEKSIIAAVNHNGDSDSTGSICGNILGAYQGLSSLPRKYLKDLELREEILEMADDLFYARLLEPEEFLGGDRRREKYGSDSEGNV